MACLLGVRKRFAESEMCFTIAVQKNRATHSTLAPRLIRHAQLNSYCPILPGLPDDVSKFCLALVPRSDFPIMGNVCNRWRSFIKSKEFLAVRKEAGKLEEWIYVLTADSAGKGSHWEVLSCMGDNLQVLPSMPGPLKAGFGVVVLDGNLLVIAGYTADIGTECISDDVYQYDSRLNRWSALAKMNVARYDFACAEVGGAIYAVGGFGSNGDSLSSAEVYDPVKNKWVLIESLRRPRWGCFGCSFEGKLYIMGGRSTFSIGNSRFADVYEPECQSWNEIKNGCVMVTSHAVLGNKLFCMEWKNQRKLVIFNSEDHSWQNVAVPLTGSSAIGFRFGILDGKLLLFSLEEDAGYQTLLFDPEAPAGSEWRTSSVKPSGSCLCSVTIKA